MNSMKKQSFGRSRRLQATLVALAGLLIAPLATEAASLKPTIVLVHGAMADASSWSGVIPLLIRDGYKVIALANPLRSVSGDASTIAAELKAIPGSIVLVGHSYGGSVITNAANQDGNVKSLVYVAAFAPEKGESAFDLVGKFPGSVLGSALAEPVILTDDSHELSVDRSKFASAFAADLPERQVEVMATIQRPITEAALKETSGEPAWKRLPSFFVYGAADKSIPPKLHDFMASRAKAKSVVVVPGASHLVMLSHPNTVAEVIEAAAQAD